MSRKARGQPKVLVVDDEPDLLELLELTLTRMGLDTTRAESVGDAILMLQDMAEINMPANHLNDQVLVRTYDHEWQEISH